MSPYGRKKREEENTKKSVFHMGSIYLLRLHDDLALAKYYYEENQYEQYYKKLKAIEMEINTKLTPQEKKINGGFIRNVIQMRRKAYYLEDSSIRYPYGYIDYLRKYERFLRNMIDTHELLIPDQEFDDPVFEATRGGR